MLIIGRKTVEHGNTQLLPDLSPVKGKYEFMASRLFDKLRAKVFLRQLMYGISRENCEVGQEVMLAKDINVS